MVRWGSVFFFALIFAAFGWWVSWSSKESPDFYVDSGFSGSRDPAAIRRSYDFSELDGVALSQATKQRLVAGARLLKESAQTGIELGHFVVRGQSGQKTFACHKYSRVLLEFEGDGVAVAGEKPQMEVEGACEISADINRISPLWVPISKILGEPVAEGEFDFRDPHPIKVRFSHVSDEWPSTWILQSVRLESEQGDALRIEGEELRQLVPKPMVLMFE